MSDMIRFNCSTCDKRLKAPRSLAGRRVKCGCGQSQVVPGPLPSEDPDTSPTTDRTPGEPLASTRCPGCNHQLRYSAERAGRQATCRSCGHLFRLPRPDEGEEDEAPSEPETAPSVPDQTQWSLCESCYSLAPTKYVNFVQIFSILVLYFVREIKGNFCKECISKHYGGFTITMALFGWFGVSVLFVPFFLVVNAVYYLRSIGLKSRSEPDQSNVVLPVIAALLTVGWFVIPTIIIYLIVTGKMR